MKGRQLGKGFIKEVPTGAPGIQSLWGPWGGSREQAPTRHYSGPLPRALFLQNVLLAPTAETRWSLDSGLIRTLTVVC